MLRHQQSFLETVTPTLHQIDLSAPYPGLTPDQDSRFEQYVQDGGLNRLEALRAVGAPVVDHVVEQGAGHPAQNHSGENIADWENGG